MIYLIFTFLIKSVGERVSYPSNTKKDPRSEEVIMPVGPNG